MRALALAVAVTLLPAGHVYDWARDLNPGLRRGWRLEAKAEHHTVKMAEAGKLFHTAPRYLGSDGEVIGYGPSRWAIWRAWLRSTLHHAILADRSRRWVGCGFARRGDVVWATCRVR